MTTESRVIPTGPAGVLARPDSPAPAQSLQVAVYTSPWSRTVNPTGVGQHILRMTECLAEAPEVSASMLITRDDYQQSREHFPDSLSDIDVHFLPGRDRWMRGALLWTPLLPVERWCGEVDWVYSPKEFPVTTRRAKLAVTVHDVLAFEAEIPGLDEQCRPRATFRTRRIMRRILQRASLIATVSEFTRQRLLDLFGSQYEARCVVVGNGVSPCYFQPAETDDSATLQRFGLTSGGYAITVGSLTFRKGGDLLLEMAHEVQRRKWPLQFVVTGRRHDAALVQRLQAMQRENPSFPVYLPGYVSDEDQAALVRQSAAFLFPSRYEGFGIPVLEAMAAGTPVVCSTAAALPEVAGTAAVLVDGEQIDEWMEPLQMLAEGQIDRQAMIATGRQHAGEQTWQRCADRLLAAMRQR